METSTTTSKICIDRILDQRGIYIEQASFDGPCRACARKFGNGYIIVLKESLSSEQKWESLTHEMAHILLGHFDDDSKTTEEKEEEAIEYSKTLFFYTVS